ncbi:MAG: hypothetical protein JST61_08715 [Acidobacteria bacterium]|nr:hypothetical protein [Acidobacteriota bacterium]
MTPQAAIMVVAPIDLNRESDLRGLLASLTVQPGVYDPSNTLIPFHNIDTLHFARFVILEDTTRDDLLAYGDPIAPGGKSLALLCDFDGEVDRFIGRIVSVAGPGLLRVFSNCTAPPSSASLTSWLHDHNVRASASYVNWVGRTVVQVREEEILYRTLEAQIESTDIDSANPRQIWNTLHRFADAERAAGRITLTPEPPTPWGWRIRNILHCIGIPLLLLFFVPLILVYLPVFLVQLRIHEKTDPVIAPRPSSAHNHDLATIEDHLVTNQFSAYGNLKPGPFRRWTITAVFLAIDYAARHIFNRGFLARVVTIQFARWVFLDGNKRAFFASNYDGSLEAYMGDFINKVAWGLNIVFSNGLGYPKTNWLIVDGAKDELTFKDYLRRHQLPTQVWYNATPGLTACDKERNARIRSGLEQPWLSDKALQQWISLF